MRQILLHPGFHKTGTSSMQHFLWINREVLEPYFDLRMFRHMKPVVRLASLFSRTNNPLDLMDMVGLLDDVFTEFPVRDDRDLMISCEGLAGQLPGEPGVEDYGAAATLLTYIAGYLAERFPNAQVKLLFTTRNPHDWLYSAYRHQLRAHRLTLDFKAFAATYQSAADLDRIIAEVAEVLTPLPVMFMPMQDALSHPLGPGAALVDQMNVPADVRARLTPVGKENEGPSDALWEQFLTLNRSTLPDRAVAEQKKALADAAALGRWKPKT
jgi:hypothetical protein